MPQKKSQIPKEVQYSSSNYKIYRYEDVSSTNKVAKQLARRNDGDKVVILAETQTKGKGRLGRRWFSPKGGLWLSIILRPEIRVKEALRLTFIAALAVVETVKTMYGLKTEIKWPNDVLINGKKLCGILTEASVEHGIVKFVVIGLGINVNIGLELFPKQLKSTVTSIKHEVGSEVKRAALLTNLLQNFEQNYTLLQQGKWTVLLKEWKSFATFLGKQVQVTNPDEIIIGKAWEVDTDGALVIKRDDGVLKKIISGDVTLRQLP
ncbi:MAG: biotin--[acetyl-CoA-carboxylase] ligase [Candidatus Bathyarchaeota archaeon]|nr:MAG: biotin--[acetyl-CoA-carboxylase] ligase [Candidatus Bathyarchaeota archaeon]